MLKYDDASYVESYVESSCHSNLNKHESNSQFSKSIFLNLKIF